MSRVFEPREFGIVPGVDCAPGLQALVNELNNRGSGIVEFPDDKEYVVKRHPGLRPSTTLGTDPQAGSDLEQASCCRPGASC
jgi:hypothetical protein